MFEDFGILSMSVCFGLTLVSILQIYYDIIYDGLYKKESAGVFFQGCA